MARPVKKGIMESKETNVKDENLANQMSIGIEVDFNGKTHEEAKELMEQAANQLAEEARQAVMSVYGPVVEQIGMKELANSAGTDEFLKSLDELLGGPNGLFGATEAVGFEPIQKFPELNFNNFLVWSGYINQQLGDVVREKGNLHNVFCEQNRSALMSGIETEDVILSDLGDILSELNNQFGVLPLTFNEEEGIEAIRVCRNLVLNGLMLMFASTCRSVNAMTERAC